MQTKYFLSKNQKNFKNGKNLTILQSYILTKYASVGTTKFLINI